MIAVSDLGKSYGPQTLFTGVSIQFNPGNRYGLVGANGSGKSTFLKILAGDEAPSEGTLSLPKRARLGVLKQDHFQYETTPILDVAMMGDRAVWEAMAEKEEILARAEESFDADRYAELEELILRHDGYALEARAGEVLEGLGIPTEVHRQPLSTLSGGFKLRVLLAQVLAAQPDVLLLDEPTNHLDIVSIRWLEKFSTAFPGTAIVISHDHRFLDNVCTHIADVDYETITLYPGNYTAFAAAKRTERERRREGDRPAREADRRPPGVRRPLPLQGDQGAPGAEQGQADREDDRSARAARRSRRAATPPSSSVRCAPAASRRWRSTGSPSRTAPSGCSPTSR